MRSRHSRLIPFTAILGQDEMKKALLLNAVNPAIGGVIIRGDKGTAKSTAVRGLAELLPEIAVVKNCSFSCDPHDPDAMCSECRSKLDGSGAEHLDFIHRKVKVISLPLGATEDRVVGSLDIHRAIKEGIKALEPGLLAAANRGILYVDEVNLLEDHIADLLLDSAALGVNIIEREGIHVTHPASFSLVGTMNPEEGEIRPQLLDRFGLQVTVGGLDDTETRIGIVNLIDEFDRHPAAVWEKCEPAQQELRDRIVQAKPLLEEVSIDSRLVELLVLTCQEFNISTHRAEITTLRAAKTLAALAGRTEASRDDVREAMYLTLPHRMRRMPFEPPVLDREQLDAKLEHVEKEASSGGPDSRLRVPRTDVTVDADRMHATPGEGTHGDRAWTSPGGAPDAGSANAEEAVPTDGPDAQASGGGPSGAKVFGIGKQINPQRLGTLEEDRRMRASPSGRRLRTFSLNRGAYVKARIPAAVTANIALDATIRAAAPHAQSRPASACAIRIENEDIREKLRISKISTSTVFLVDASGSMEAHERMESAKGAIFSMLVDSYQRRDRVGMVVFRDDRAEKVLPMCSSLDSAVKCLKDIPTGGRTPISAGLQKAVEMLIVEKRRSYDVFPIVVLISDGRANVALGPFSSVRDELLNLTAQAWKNRIHMTFIDVEHKEEATSRFGSYKQILIDRMSYYHVDHLSSGVITDIVAREKRLLLSSLE